MKKTLATLVVMTGVFLNSWSASLVNLFGDKPPVVLQNDDDTKKDKKSHKKNKKSSCCSKSCRSAKKQSEQ
ncbi:MAG: hypothetical protein RMJ44_07415 [Cytophagales bacterium]|nr:hypothetical protein [Cytophagales bacterium]